MNWRGKLKKDFESLPEKCPVYTHDQITQAERENIQGIVQVLNPEPHDYLLHNGVAWKKGQHRKRNAGDRCWFSFFCRMTTFENKKGPLLHWQFSNLSLHFWFNSCSSSTSFLIFWHAAVTGQRVTSGLFFSSQNLLHSIHFCLITENSAKLMMDDQCTSLSDLSDIVSRLLINLFFFTLHNSKRIWSFGILYKLHHSDWNI